MPGIQHDQRWLSCRLLCRCQRRLSGWPRRVPCAGLVSLLASELAAWRARKRGSRGGRPQGRCPGHCMVQRGWQQECADDTRPEAGEQQAAHDGRTASHGVFLTHFLRKVSLHVDHGGFMCIVRWRLAIGVGLLHGPDAPVTGFGSRRVIRRFRAGSGGSQGRELRTDRQSGGRAVGGGSAPATSVVVRAAPLYSITVGAPGRPRLRLPVLD